MPVSKNADRRIRFIDQKIISTKWFSREDILDAVNDMLELEGQGPIALRQFAKDIDYIRGETSKDFVDLIYSRFEGRYKYSDPDYSLYGIPVNEKDIELMTQALAILKSIHGLKNTKELEHIIERLVDKMGLRVEQLDNVIMFDAVPDLRGIGFLNALLKKIVSNQVVVMHYKTFGGEETSYIFHPYFLKEYNNRWYVFGWNEEEDKIYNVPLDRIEEFEDSSLPYNSGKKVSPKKDFADIVGVTRQDAPVETIKFRVNKSRTQYVNTKPIHKSQKKVNETKTYIDFSIQVIRNKELESMFLSFGKDFNEL